MNEERELNANLHKDSSIEIQGGGVTASEVPVEFLTIESPGRNWIFPYSRILFAHTDTEGSRFFLRTISHDIWINGQNLNKAIYLIQQGKLMDVRKGYNENGKVDSIEVMENPGGMFA
ncbi:hypothetical protein [Methylacidiphilum caldifontis]|uniref:Uncharacterized protein n=1 Tax=Methylacidiphilum caldifontis TaxID=2795386 RepID=A0A4Y8PB67_9BACT|nr:hypothetical protein [Methylacidiphilum caldifontis]QSR88208.1 hypothetical protein IT6_07400 [Methylacidiphilum caldifontis]TFE68247.1 hypothetical protein A7Q10_00985 [Methylacidiphilum caldifontis]